MKRLAFVLALLACGCGGGDDAAPATPTEDARTDAAIVDTSAPEQDALVTSDSEPSFDGAPGDAELFGPYPPGPYGNKLGDVVANLAWEGHRNPLADELSTKKPYGATDLDQLRRDAKKGYALVHVSEFF